MTKTYRRDPKVKEPVWHSAVCAGEILLVRIGEDASLCPDGFDADQEATRRRRTCVYFEADEEVVATLSRPHIVIPGRALARTGIEAMLVVGE